MAITDDLGKALDDMSAALSELENRLNAMGSLHQQLRTTPATGLGDVMDKLDAEYAAIAGQSIVAATVIWWLVGGDPRQRLANRCT